MLKIDMHIHTYSYRHLLEILEVANRKNLDGVAITDHDTLRGAREAQKRSQGLVIIPGQEIITSKGEILALGITKLVPKNLPIDEAIKRVHSQGGLAIVPHPTLPFFSKLKPEELKNLLIDGLEAISAATPLPQYYLRKNVKLAVKFGLSIVAGSDSHFSETVGDAFTLVRSETREVADVLHAIKQGHTMVGGELSGLNFKPKRMALAALTLLWESVFSKYQFLESSFPFRP